MTTVGIEGLNHSQVDEESRVWGKSRFTAGRHGRTEQI